MIEKRSAIFPAAIALWAGIQALAILLATSEIPLWAHHPVPRSSLAINELLAVQLISISILAPLLGKTVWTIIVNVATTLSFLELAGLLGSEPQSEIIKIWLFVSLWEIGMCGWSANINPKRRNYLLCSAAFFTIGGVILDYLRAETAAISGTAGSELIPVGPLSAALRGGSTLGWIQVLIPLIGWLISAVARSRKQSKNPIPHFFPPD